MTDNSTNSDPAEILDANGPCGAMSVDLQQDATPHADDAHLLEAAQRGDHGAFATFVRRHERMVWGYLRARLPNAADAEDLCQEVFLRLYSGKAVPREAGRSDLRAWLLGIARNVLREYVRKTRRRREIAWTELCLELETDGDGDVHTYEETLAHLPGCLQSLGPSARQAIDLYYHDDLSMRDIAERFKRSEGAVKLLVFRARQAVKRCLDNRLVGGIA
jgi:RNA polymerase sigma-70 factor, ECF subfamily